MSNSFFKFKQFTVEQDKCAMKVGTDGVLLGAWTDINNTGNILDVGTGTGLVALMLAQRSQAMIDAIDIDEDAYKQAKDNFTNSPFRERIQVYHQPFAYFKASKRYDLVVSNPPYFVDSLKSPEIKRTLARHNDSLLLDDLIRLGKTLLTSKGRIALILPFEQEKELEKAIRANSLNIIRRTNVIPVVNGKPKRILVEIAARSNPTYQTDTLSIEIERHIYTSEYQKLTKDFYLKM